MPGGLIPSAVRSDSMSAPRYVQPNFCTVHALRFLVPMRSCYKNKLFAKKIKKPQKTTSPEFSP